MQAKKSSFFCPQCGAPDGRPVPGSASDSECLRCGTRFAVIQRKGQSAQRSGLGDQTVAGAAGAGMDARGGKQVLGRAARWVFGLVALAVVAAVVTPMLLRSKPAPAHKAAAMGRMDLSTVFDNGGKISFIALYENRKAEQTDFVIRVTDMSTGKLLSEPQRLSFSASRSSRREEFKQLSDGQLYLLLKESQLMRFDTGAQQFVDITSLLAARFGKELGGGISKIEFAFHEYPDSFKVTTREGKEYLVYWLINQIHAYDDFGPWYEKAVKSYRQSSKFYRFAPIGSGSSTRYQLVQYWAKTEPGQPLHRGYFELLPHDNEVVLSRHRGSVNVGSGYSVAPYVINRGLIKIEAIAPLALRFDADILAENDKRLLLAYHSTPQGEDGRVLQLMDKSNHQIVWSRTAAQIPQLSQDLGRGQYVEGVATPSGFYLAGSPSQPALFIDNDGNTVHDFVANKPQ